MLTIAYPSSHLPNATDIWATMDCFRSWQVTSVLEVQSDPPFSIGHIKEWHHQNGLFATLSSDSSRALSGDKQSRHVYSSQPHHGVRCFQHTSMFCSRLHFTSISPSTVASDSTCVRLLKLLCMFVLLDPVRSDLEKARTAELIYLASVLTLSSDE